MFVLRPLFVLLLVAFCAPKAQAQAQTQAQAPAGRPLGEVETAVPSLSATVGQAIQSAAYLQDALVLSAAQARALRTETILEVRALALAPDAARALAAENYHLRTVAHLLTARQFGNYCELRRRMAEADSLPNTRVVTVGAGK